MAIRGQEDTDGLAEGAVWIRRNYHTEKIGPFDCKKSAQAYIAGCESQDDYWGYDSPGIFTRQSWMDFHQGWDPMLGIDEQPITIKET